MKKTLLSMVALSMLATSVASAGEKYNCVVMALLGGDGFSNLGLEKVKATGVDSEKARYSWSEGFETVQVEKDASNVRGIFEDGVSARVCPKVIYGPGEGEPVKTNIQLGPCVDVMVTVRTGSYLSVPKEQWDQYTNVSFALMNNSSKEARQKGLYGFASAKTSAKEVQGIAARDDQATNNQISIGVNCTPAQ